MEHMNTDVCSSPLISFGKQGFNSLMNNDVQSTIIELFLHEKPLLLLPLCLINVLE